MIIGIPKEIKIGENRVGATPAGVNKLVKADHTIYVEKGAGEGSGFEDDGYQVAGAKLFSKSAEIWKAEMILKVKEPEISEYELLRESQLLFTYLHLANPGLKNLTRVLMDKKVTAIAYESVQLSDESLPLLEPMSEVAGKMSIQIAANLLQKPYGRGILIGGVPGVKPCNVVIIGAGTVGWNATQVALGMGANVKVINRGIKRLRHVNETLGVLHPGNLTTVKLSPYSLKEALIDADIVIGAVLTPGTRSPILVSREMVKNMKKGSVIVDVGIDQGGIFETSYSTTHENPTYIEEGVIHYCVPNMPGALPRTSTIALTNATLPYALELANLDFVKSVKRNPALAKGVNVYGGHITNEEVANTHGFKHRILRSLL